MEKQDNKTKMKILVQTLPFILKSGESINGIHGSELENFAGYIAGGALNDVKSEVILTQVLPLMCWSKDVDLSSTTIANIIASEPSRAVECLEVLEKILQENTNQFFVRYVTKEFVLSIILAILQAGSLLRYGVEANESNSDEIYVVKVYQLIILLSTPPEKDGLISKLLDYYAENHLQVIGKFTHLFKTVFIEFAGQNYLSLFHNFSNEANVKKFNNRTEMYLMFVQEIADKIYLSLDVQKKYQLFHQLQFLNK